MAEISVRDLLQMYKSSVVLYEKSPVHILSIDERRNVGMWDLKEQKLKTVVFDENKFSPPKARLGYVNLGTNCIYLVRKPVRRYKIGINSENVAVDKQAHPLSPNENDECYEVMTKLRAASLYNTMMGIYPSIEEAIQESHACKGVVAFDRQFAVDFKNRIYYKGSLVGGCDLHGNITFKEGKEHLINALNISRS